MIGFLFVAAVLMVCALLAFRMIPSYIEFYTVQKALKDAIAETRDPTTQNIRRYVERKLSASFAKSPAGGKVETVVTPRTQRRAGARLPRFLVLRAM